MDQLRAGDSVYSVDSNGDIVPDTILTFMDVRFDVIAGKQASRHFVSIETESGHLLRLTRNHLVHSWKRGSVTFNSSPTVATSTAIFAGKVQKGDYVFVSDLMAELPSNTTVRPTKVLKVDHVVTTSGAYAPLTNGGTILVEGTMTSCYAVFENDYLAHLIMAPARVYYKVQSWVSLTEQNYSTYYGMEEDKYETEGVMLYADLLFRIANKFIPEPWFWGD